MNTPFVNIFDVILLNEKNENAPVLLSNIKGLSTLSSEDKIKLF